MYNFVVYVHLSGWNPASSLAVLDSQLCSYIGYAWAQGEPKAAAGQGATGKGKLWNSGTAFDAAKIKGNQLVVRMASEGEQITTLDEVERKLTANMTVIADAERPLVIAGVMGSLDAEVEETTTDIVLEAAYFAPTSIRATARKLNLSSDSSYRFERGVDPKGVIYASLRAVDLILEVAGGTVDGNLIEEGAEPPTISEVKLYPERVRTFIGFDIGDAEMQAVLESLGLGITIHDEGDGGIRWLHGGGAQRRAPVGQGESSQGGAEAAAGVEDLLRFAAADDRGRGGGAPPCTRRGRFCRSPPDPRRR